MLTLTISACKNRMDLKRTLFADHDRVALVNSHIRVVQAALLGSVLVNLLLILGSAVLVGCIKRTELKHGLDQSQALAGLLCISVFSLLVPVSPPFRVEAIAN
jgi:Ca2+:H+ antiporter